MALNTIAHNNEKCSSSGDNGPGLAQAKTLEHSARLDPLTRWPFVIVIVCVMAVGAVFMFLAAREAEEVMKRTMLSQARMLVESIDQGRFARLTATLADEQSPDYHALHDTLARMRAANPTYRYLYLMGKGASGPPFFYMGSALAGSDEYSPPGQPYPEEAPTLAHVFATEEAALSDPVTDRWGTWVSALVPLQDTNTGRMLAVFGMDVDASDWQASVRTRVLLTGALTLVVVFLVLLLFFVLRNRQRSRTEHLLLDKNRLLGVQAAELKDSSEQMQAQKDRYGFTIESTNLGTWEWNVQTGETVFNELFVGMAGYTLAELAPISFKTWEYLAHPDDLRASNLALERHFKGETEFYECECRIKHKDGRWVWVLDRGKVISRTENGEPLWAYGTHQDITERKQVEQTIRDNDARLRAITDSAQDAIILMDSRGAISFWNPAAEKILGYRTTEAIGRNLHELLAPERYVRRYRAAFPEFLRSGQGTSVGRTLELEARHKNGLEIVLSLSLSSVSIGGEWHAVGILRDVTDIKRAEAQLRESEERFRGILQNVSTVAVQGYAMDGTVTYWNSASESFYGFTAEEALGRNLLDLIIPPDMRGEVNSAIKRMSHTGEAIPSAELALMRKDGSRIPVYSSHALVQAPGKNVELFCIDVDLTERKRVEDALQTSETTFRNIVEASPMGIHMYQLHEDSLIFTGSNRAADRILGTDNSAFIGLTIEEAFPALRDTEVPQRYRKAARDGEGWYTVQVEYQDGWISGAYEVYAFQMSPGKTAALFNDITDRKRAEEELHQANLVVENSPAVLFRWKVAENWPVIMVSRNVSQFGYSQEDLLSGAVTYPDLVYPDDVERMNSEIEHYTSNNIDRYRQEYRVVTRGGEVRWVDDRTTVIRGADGQVIEYQGIVLDITERKQAEQQLQRQTALFQNLFKSSPEAIAVLDHEDRVLEINHSFETLFGYCQTEARGQDINDLIAPEPYREDALNVSERVVREGHVVEKEAIRCAKDGHPVAVSLIGYPLIEDKKQIGAFAIYRDITDYKKMQELMIQTEKMVSVGGIAAGIAHEINNPLGIVLQASQNLAQRMRLDFPKNQEVARGLGLDVNVMGQYVQARKLDVFLEDIQSGAKRAATIIRQMLDFTRRSESRRTLCNPADLVRTALTLVQSDYDLKKNYDFKKIQVNFVEEEGLPSVLCTETEIEQVLLNVLRNAAQAMAEAVPPIVDPCINIRLSSASGVIRMEFADNGPGIPADTLGRIFEPFFTTKGPGKGTGLGLSVSYFIITQGHGGRMYVESAPGEGARFCIELPVSAAVS